MMEMRQEIIIIILLRQLKIHAFYVFIIITKIYSGE